jgi:flagellar biosynthetic protein FliR
MRLALGLPVGTLYAFLLVLARVSGLIAFLPVPGFRSAPGAIRAFLALAVTFALFPVWPDLLHPTPAIGDLVAWVFAEMGFGLAAGAAVGMLTDSFQMAMQILGLQAGYGYATTIDPTSQADAGVLQIMASLFTGLLFFALGFDRELFQVLAATFERFPAGSWAPSVASLDGLIRLGGGMFSLALRIAMPIAALLLLIDVALALLGRMQQQLQLLSVAFPVKMLVALVVLALTTPAMVRLFQTSAVRTMAALWNTLAR